MSCFSELACCNKEEVILSTHLKIPPLIDEQIDWLNRSDVVVV